MKLFIQFRSLHQFSYAFCRSIRHNTTLLRDTAMEAATGSTSTLAIGIGSPFRDTDPRPPASRSLYFPSESLISVPVSWNHFSCISHSIFINHFIVNFCVSHFDIFCFFPNFPLSHRSIIGPSFLHQNLERSRLLSPVVAGVGDWDSQWLKRLCLRIRMVLLPKLLHFGSSLQLASFCLKS